jgi:Ni/Co efflux regulator RcnB
MYGWPVGYGYFQYGPGMFLPSVFFSAPQYMLLNYLDFELGPPPYGFQWIRLGPDLLLVNLSNGQISEAVPGMFVESTDVGAAAYPSTGDPNAN